LFFLLALVGAMYGDPAFGACLESLCCPPDRYVPENSAPVFHNEHESSCTCECHQTSNNSTGAPLTLAAPNPRQNQFDSALSPAPPIIMAMLPVGPDFESHSPCQPSVSRHIPTTILRI
ncbi:MAG: hypothetical protein PHC61_07645, partial [Chitinivibrionales bacterium]|nr:hypothetical protein [Chitinivibrionales bacterium]